MAVRFSVKGSQSYQYQGSRPSGSIPGAFTKTRLIAMDTMHIGPFTAPEIDTIQNALKAQLDNLEDFMDHGMDPVVDAVGPFLEEQNRIGRIIEKIETNKLIR